MADPVTKESLLNTLGLPLDATAPQIKEASRKEAKRWHPDTATANKHDAEAKFMEVRAAYEQLVKQPRGSRMSGDVYTTEGVRASENAQKMTRSPGNVRAQELRRYAKNSSSALPLKIMTGLILTMTGAVAMDIYGRKRFPWQQPGGADIRDLRIFQPGSLLGFFGKR